ncbi:hypothetical protein QR680_010019 [Steinernema hermaphroditum]|uniref:7TM GPCR serpentine receptor class x (Srx) domain-containing protein n=1 Tax=Steinernema hermaphroditum TaxID=289476 RepID=A0AA39IMG3_9BILA|nr:hypothetical protein QR680_010019 [Steinernema hermaphroditum]
MNAAKDVEVVVSSIFGIISGVICTPLLTRTAYLFYTHPDYRELNSYRLMAHHGVCYSLFGPLYVTLFIGILTDSDLGGVVIIASALIQALWQILLIITLSLAINRFSVIANIASMDYASKIVSVLGAAFGIAYFVILMTPLAGLQLHDGLALYDEAKPLSKVVEQVYAHACIATTSASLIVYIILFGYIAWKHVKYSLSHISKTEKLFAVKALMIALSQFSVECMFIFVRPAVHNNGWKWAGVVMLESSAMVILPLIILIIFGRHVQSSFNFSVSDSLGT